MPRISAFYGVVIYMYWNERDHPVVHFHAYHAGRRASVSVNGEVLAGQPGTAGTSVRQGVGQASGTRRFWRTGSGPGGTSL